VGRATVELGSAKPRRAGLHRPCVARRSHPLRPRQPSSSGVDDGVDAACGAAALGWQPQLPSVGHSPRREQRPSGSNARPAATVKGSARGRSRRRESRPPNASAWTCRRRGGRGRTRQRRGREWGDQETPTAQSWRPWMRPARPHPSGTVATTAKDARRRARRQPPNPHRQLRQSQVHPHQAKTARPAEAVGRSPEGRHHHNNSQDQRQKTHQSIDQHEGGTDSKLKEGFERD